MVGQKIQCIGVSKKKIGIGMYGSSDEINCNIPIGSSRVTSNSAKITSNGEEVTSNGECIFAED